MKAQADVRRGLPFSTWLNCAWSRCLRAMALVAVALACGRGQAAPRSRPAAGAAAKANVVIVLADDLGWWSVGCYGDPNVKTPNLDKLAKEGLKFEQAFANAPVCTPCRCALGTGLYPIRSRILSNETLPKAESPGLRSMAEHLVALGYRVGLTGKTDTGPYDGSKAKYSVTPEKFIKDKSDRPFFLLYGSNHPHSPWNNPPQLRPEKITVPPMLVDNAETRKALCSYYADVVKFDDEVGDCMQWVEEAGLASNTVFIATGEQGAPFPGGKWTCYDDGLRTVLLARWPGKIRAGSRTAALVQYIDFAPTLVELAGGNPAACDTGLPGAAGGGKGFDGRSFLAVLLGKKSTHDAFVYGAYRDTIRAVRDSRYLYIDNCRPVPSDGMAWALGPVNIWKSWKRDAAGDQRWAGPAARLRKPPAEEFYDTANDPHQLNNLANEPQHREQLASLKKQLDLWRKQYGDDKPPAGGAEGPVKKAAKPSAAKKGKKQSE